LGLPTTFQPNAQTGVAVWVGVALGVSVGGGVRVIVGLSVGGAVPVGTGVGGVPAGVLVGVFVEQTPV
jgi:hypothetical protein